MNTTSRIEKTVFIPMVRPIIPQPITDMGYGGMDFLNKFKGKLKDNKAPISQGGSFMQNAAQLTAMNGSQRFDTGETSQGAQELAQKVNENEKTGLMQKVAGFLQNQNPYQELMRDTSVEDPVTGQRINQDLLKLLNNRPDLRERFNETGSIFSEM